MRIHKPHSLPERLIASVLIAAFVMVADMHGVSWLEIQKAFAFTVPPGSAAIAGALGNAQDVGQVSHAFQTDLYTGRAQFSIPISVPAGRRGLTPQVSLNYSSSGGNAWAGVGWDVDYGFIQRATKNGVPAYNDNTDIFTFLVNQANSDLVKIGATEYHAKEESGDFLKFIFQDNYWTVYDKSGTQFIFGQSPATKLQNSRGIFSWGLEKVKDIHGNTITYTYRTSQGEMFLQRIDYNGNETQSFAATHSIEFFAEPRPDVTFSYISGAKAALTERLQRIEVRVLGQLARKYTLTYQQSPGAGRSRLVSVQECGSDNGNSCLPAQTFEYQDQTFGFQNNVTWPQFDSSMGYISDGIDAETLVTGDMDGDGLPDRLKKISNSQWRFFKNTGSGHTGWVPWNNVQGGTDNNWGSIRADSNGTGSYVNLIDLNSDYRLDRVLMGTGSNVGGSTGWAVQYNNGCVSEGCSFGNPIYFGVSSTNNRFVRAGYWYHPDFPEDPDTLVINWDILDMNGDGYLDRVDSTPNTTWTVYYGNASGFSETPYMWTPIQGSCGQNHCQAVRDYDGDQQNSGTDAFDMNGDSLPDRVVGGSTPPSDYNSVVVQYNNGYGFEPPTIYGPYPGTFAGGIVRNNNGGNTTLDYEDMNSDGLPDRVVKNSDSEWLVYFNTGSGFSAAPVSWGNIQGYSSSDRVISRTEGTRVTVDLMDLNGDALTDRVVTNGTANWLVQLAYPTFPDLLKKVRNGRGGETTITYKPSTQFYNGGADGKPDLPFALNVVSTVMHADGLGNQTTSTYEYFDGLYDSTDREFRGFNHTRVIDSRSHHTDTFFKQDDVHKGKPYLVETRDAAGNIYTQVWTIWQSSNPFTGVTFSFVKSTTNWVYDGNGTARVSQVDNVSFDNYGNVKETISWGEVFPPGGWNAITGDEIHVKTYYTYNPALWIMNRPKFTETFNSDWQRVSQSWFYYDGSNNYDTPPTKGLMTRKDGLIEEGGLHTTAQMTYDAFGNLLVVRDSYGRASTNEYDPALKLYVARVTNVLGHSQQFTYDSLNGQVTQTIDPNGQISQTRYDPFGRPVKIIAPSDTEAAPSQVIYYDDTSVPNRVITHVKHDPAAPAVGDASYHLHAGYLTTFSFYDGLGREIQKRVPAEDYPAHQIVSGIVTFDDRGQVEKQFYPYTANFSSVYNTTLPGTPFVKFSYDAIGRTVRTDYPESTPENPVFSTVEYDDFVKTVTDQNGHRKRYTQDVYGNVVKVEEFNGSETYTTTYGYDTLNRLISTTDHFGNVTQITYDFLGRKRTMDDANMGHWEYSYDDNGNLISQTDSKYQTISFAYDAINRLISKTYPDGSQVRYTYDTCPTATCGGLAGENYPIGKLLKAEDASGIQTFRYDRLGRVVQDQKSIDDGNDYSFTRVYDALGRVSSLEYPDGDIMALTFNSMGEAETLTLIKPDQTQAPIISNVDYNVAGQITLLQYGNGVRTDYTYSPQNFRLQDLLTRGPGNVTLQQLHYAFNNVGNVTDITDSVNTNTQHFQYDDLDRLIQAQGSYGTHLFQYNAVGNMTRKHTASLFYQDYAHPHAVTQYLNGSENITYQYDPNGNLASRRLSNSVREVLSYDYDNRLTKLERQTTTSCQIQPVPQDYITYTNAGTNESSSGNARSRTPKEAAPDLETESLPADRLNNSRPDTIIYPCDGRPHTTTATIAQYVYDASGQRAVKMVGNKTTYYLGKDFEREYNGSSMLTRKAFFLGDTRVAEYELAGTSGAVPHLRFFHQDHLGSTNIVTNEQGQQTLLMEYLPYGEVKRIVGSDPVQNTYTGQKSDSESNLMYYNARYYDPKIGRFITADPTIQSPYDPQDLNRYAYVRNNPINFIDPTGFGWFKKIFKKIKKFFKKHGAKAGGFIGAVIGAIVGSILPGVGTVAGASIGGAIGGGAGGGLQAGLNGGGLGQIAMGIVSGAIEGYAIGQVVGGVTQGVIDWAVGNGQLIFPGGVQGSAGDIATKYRGNIATNGILVSPQDAQAFANTNGVPVFYNPSHGGIADLTESLLQKVTGTSSIGRQFGNVLLQAGGPANIIAHSQGALTASNAFLSIAMQGKQLAAGSQISFAGPATNSLTTSALAKFAGVTVAQSRTHFLDPISLVQPSLRPAQLVGGLLGIATGSGIQQHTNYDFRSFRIE